jgi:hypothetical protein
MRRACRRLGRATIERARWGGVNYASTPTTLVNFAALGVDFQIANGAQRQSLASLGPLVNPLMTKFTLPLTSLRLTSRLPANLIYTSVPKRQSDLKR